MMNVLDNFPIYFEKYKKLGTSISLNETVLIGRALHIGSEAWLHELYKGLTEAEVSSLETNLNVFFSPDFKYFLKLSNGLSFFVSTLSIYGLRKTNSRDHQIREPFSIISKNQNEKPLRLLKQDVLIGSYYADGSILVLDCLSGKLYRYNKAFEKKLNVWESFSDFMNAELPRIDSLFNNEGILTTDVRLTPPQENEVFL